MSVFNIIAGTASIISLIISIIAIKKVVNIETRININDQSTNIIDSSNKISQKASGKDITQAGRDINV